MIIQSLDKDKYMFSKSLSSTEYIYSFAVYSFRLQNMVMFVMVYDNNGLSKHCTSWFFALCLYMKKILVFKNSALLFSICHGKKQTTKLIASVMRSITMNPIGHVKFCQRSKIESHKFNFIFCPLF